MNEEEKKEEGQESQEQEEQAAITLLRQIAQIMEETDLTEVSYEEGDIKLSLKRGLPVQATPQQTVPQLPVLQNDVLEGETVNTGPGELVNIGAFMLGTFYSAPEPGAEPYVEVGVQVNEGSPLCVIDAMKHFNEQKAEFDCEIVEILVEDGERIEYEQPLFKVRRLS